MTQPQDKIRAEFEASMIEHMPHADFAFHDECYANPWLQASWTGWKYCCAQQSEASATLSQIAEVAACFGADWPDVDGEPEVLRRVKWAARQLTWQSAQSQQDALDAARWRLLREEHEGKADSLCVFGPNDMRECLVPIGSLPGELDAFVDSFIATQEASNV